MKRLTFLAFFFAGMLLFQNNVLAQSKDQAELKQLVEDYVAAIENGTGGVFFDEIAMEGYFLTKDDGSVWERAKVLSAFRTNTDNYNSIRLGAWRIQVYKNSAVVSTVRTITGTQRNGASLNEKHRYTDLFIKEKGDWKLATQTQALLE